MKFLYEYRTPDNAKHDGVICASGREAAYAELKKKGIKPSRFAEAPGFFNKLFGKGKRWLAIGVLGAALAIVVGRGVLVAPQSSSVETVIESQVRRQVIGDAAIIDEGIRTGWADVFKLEGDRFLASFAIPGVPVAVRSTSEEKLRETLASPSSPIPHPSSPGSVSLEARQIRAMVAGMKRELQQYLADGGTVVKYGERLVERQEYELSVYRRAKTEYETAKREGASEADLAKLLATLNVSLRKMGIRPLVRPTENF